MFRFASALTKISMVLASMVALVGVGVLISSAIPDLWHKEPCEYATPVFAQDGIEMGKHIIVEAAPVSCLKKNAEQGTVRITLNLENAAVLQNEELSMPMNPDGSYRAVIPMDPNNAGSAGTITVITRTSAPNCDSLTSSCAVVMHELRAVVD